MDTTSSIKRKNTRQILVGNVPVGGNAPITVQSMTTTKTSDVDATLQQIYSLAAAGADIVRCTCNDFEAAEGLAQIVPRSPVPIVADVHNQYKMALAAIASGVDCLRLNPGNIRKPAHIKAVAEAAGEQSVPIRIGVNGGSLHPELYERYGGKVTSEAMVEFEAASGTRTAWREKLREVRQLCAVPNVDVEALRSAKEVCTATTMLACILGAFYVLIMCFFWFSRPFPCVTKGPRRDLQRTPPVFTADTEG